MLRKARIDMPGALHHHLIIREICRDCAGSEFVLLPGGEGAWMESYEGCQKDEAHPTSGKYFGKGGDRIVKEKGLKILGK